MTNLQNKFNNNSYNMYYNCYNDFSDMEALNIPPTEEKKEYNKFMQKLKYFDEIHTIQEAKELAAKLFHIKNEINHIKAGAAFCTITSTAKRFQIVVNTNEEVVCYNFKEKQ